MAPIKKRASIRARATAATKPAKSPRDAISHPTSTHPSTATAPSDPDFRATKKNKREVRHNALMDKVHDAGVTKKTKRRRPGKKLGVSLGGLGDALPDLDGEGDEEGEWEGLSEDEGMEVDAGAASAGKKKRRRAGAEGKMVMRSVKSRPGAMKRKRLLEGREMERFGRNLAQLVGSGEGKGAVQVGNAAMVQEAEPASQSDRWAALREFIGGSMEKDKAFAAG